MSLSSPDSWEPIMKEVPCLPALAAYRYKEKGFENMDEFMLQMEECRQAPYVYGNIWFTTHSLFRPDFLEYMKEKIYPYPSLVPKLGASSDIVPASPVVKVSDRKLKWSNAPGAEYYAVYKLDFKGENALNGIWEANLIATTKSNKFKETEHGVNYIVISVNGKEKSSPSNVVFIR